MSKTTPPDIADAINKALGESDAAWKCGKVEKAADLMEKAWELLPLPREEYDWAQILGNIGTEFFRDAKMITKADEWLTRLRKAYGAPSETTGETIDLLEATIRFEAGDFDRSFALFHKHFKEWKNRIFEGENPKYKKFYHAEVARRK